MWVWKDLRIPPAFCHLVQATSLGILDDELVVQAIARTRGRTSTIGVRPAPRVVGQIPERASEVPRSQVDTQQLEEMYPLEVRSTTYVHATPPPPVGEPSHAPPTVGSTSQRALEKSKVEAERLLQIANLQLRRGKIRSNELDFRLRRLSLLCASTGWTPFAGDVKDVVTSAESLLLTVFRNGIPDGYLDFQVGFRWWEASLQPLTPSQRYEATFTAWWQEQPNSITPQGLRLKTSNELKSAIAMLENELTEIDEDTAKCLTRLVELRMQIKRL
ncbi:hypothetical protein CC2G_004330 [Coprinopsis cinerea AmutBmut pab1-1]|nr:hypothetical protein CC2G_004330 [Coprinopsis cinerea AmutBmut pab1-1]